MRARGSINIWKRGLRRHKLLIYRYSHCALMVKASAKSNGNLNSAGAFFIASFCPTHELSAGVLVLKRGGVKM